MKDIKDLETIVVGVNNASYKIYFDDKNKDKIENICLTISLLDGSMFYYDIDTTKSLNKFIGVLNVDLQLTHFNKKPLSERIDFLTAFCERMETSGVGEYIEFFGVNLDLDQYKLLRRIIMSYLDGDTGFFIAYHMKYYTEVTLKFTDFGKNPTEIIHTLSEFVKQQDRIEKLVKIKNNIEKL